MKKIGAEFAAGVSIFLAFIIFVGGFLFMKNIALNAGTYSVKIRFADVTGLERHDRVSVSGLKIGKVDRFQLDGLEVIATIEVNPGIKLPKDSRAQIRTLGMVGEKFIDIIPGKAAEILQDGDMIPGRASSDFEEITGTMDGLMQQAEDLLIKIRSIVENVFDEEAQADLKGSMRQVNQLTAALDERKTQMQKTLGNMEQLSASLNGILTERRDKVESSIDNIYAATNKLDDLTAKVDQSLTRVNNLVAKIENEEGTVGKLIARDEPYNDFRHLAAELDTLVTDLKKRPQKYLNLGFIKVF